jgi:hypothetical protein
LGFPTPVVSTYPRETVVAEKFQAMVMLGMANSRMKDFFDLWLLSVSFEFDGEVLARAIQATFERRRTPLPETIPTALSADFYDDDCPGQKADGDGESSAWPTRPSPCTTSS